jgi:hypothetical protein
VQAEGVAPPQADGPRFYRPLRSLMRAPACGPGGGQRSPNLLIKSQLLCQLSYTGTGVWLAGRDSLAKLARSAYTQPGGYKPPALTVELPATGADRGPR